MPEGLTRRMLRVQTILYRVRAESLWRLLHGLDAAATHALGAGAVSQVEWAIGDCSENRLLGESLGTELAAAATSLAGVTMTVFDENLGHGGGQNRLAAAGGGELLLFLNPDTYPAPTAITELISALDGANAGLVDARQIPLEHPKQYDPVTGEVGWASGACMLARRSIFDAVSGFDSVSFPLHCDDVDLSWRVRAAGGPVLTAAAATVFHDKRPERGKDWPAPDSEVFHAVLGRLMLATRWSRLDIVEETLAYVRREGSDPQRAAADEYERRAMDGRIPAPASNPSVAEFIDGEYARHRF